MSPEAQAAPPAFDRVGLSASLLEESSLPFFVSLADGRMLFANPAFQSLVGYSEDELTTNVSWATDLTPERWADFESKIVDQVARTGRPERYEKEYVHRDGTVIPVELHLHCAKLDGDPLFYGFAVDVSERHRDRNELKFLSAIPLANPNPIIELDHEWNITFVNPAAEGLVGLLGEAGGHHDAFEPFRTAAGGLQPRFAQVTLEDRSFLISALPLESGTRLYATEVTAETKAKQALEDSERRFRSIFENAAAGIARVAVDGRFIEVNSTFAEMLGYAREELIGKTFGEITHPDDLDRDLEQAKLLDDGAIDSYRMDKRYLRKDGSALWVELTGSAVRREDGTTDHFVAVVTDISARKEAEQQVDEELGRTALLLDTLGTLVAELELEQVCDTLAGVLSEVLDQRRVLVGVYNPAEQTLVLKGVRNSVKPANTVWRLADLPAVCREIFEGAGTRIVDFESADASDADRVVTEPLGVRLGLYVPIRSQGRTLGVIISDSQGARLPFSQRQVAITEAVAEKAAVAIHNAVRYGRQREIAGVLQDALLALPKRIDGLEFSHVYRSAGTALKAGGDFLDIFPLRRRRVGLLIGDVSGKGLDAAVVTAVVRNSVRAYAMDDMSPAEVLSKTNGLLRQVTRPEIFATAFFAELDLESGRVVYANGGHPNPVCIGSDGTLRPVEGADPIIGAFDDCTFNDRLFVLAPDQVFVAFTDGVTECRRDGVMYGADALARNLAQCAGATPKDICKTLYDDLWAYSDGHLEDDVAILAVQRSGRRVKPKGLEPLF